MFLSSSYLVYLVILYLFSVLDMYPTPIVGSDGGGLVTSLNMPKKQKGLIFSKKLAALLDKC